VPANRRPFESVRANGGDQDDELERVDEGEAAQLTGGDPCLEEVPLLDRAGEAPVRRCLDL
jgi:hypothetical protein